MIHEAPPLGSSAPVQAGRTATPVVALRGVHRAFGADAALAGFDLAVPERSISVLLGPNGAGKTTAIRVITGALPPDNGTVSVFGLDPSVDGEEVRRRCGVVSATPAFYDRLSGRDNLRYAAELHGLGRGDFTERAIYHAANRFGIAGDLDQLAGGYSTGMRTRLALARSILHEPDLLLLDEPTSGLDPESAHAVLELIRDMPAEGRTVLMCTHLLLEAEGLADQVVVLDGGATLVSGAPGELAARLWPGTTLLVDAEDRGSLRWIAGHDGVVGFELGVDGPARVSLDDERRIPDIAFALARAGVRITRIDPHRPSLEDLYLAVRGTGPADRIGEAR